jgi:hypothetical protein
VAISAQGIERHTQGRVERVLIRYGMSAPIERSRFAARRGGDNEGGNSEIERKKHVSKREPDTRNR